MSAEQIVVGLDGSPSAQRAVDWALSWAQSIGADVRIIASEALPPGHSPDDPDLGAKAEEIIEAEKQRLGSAPDGVKVELVALVSHPVTALLDASKEAAALVVGTRGVGAFKGSVVGSTSGAIAAQAYCPTVVIAPGCPEDFDAEGPIVVGFDGSEPSVGAARLAISAAAEEDRTVRLVQAEADETEESLDGVVEKFRAEHPGVDIELVTEGGAPEEVLPEASRDAAYVVMASQGHRGVPGFLLGSTTRAVIQEAQAPVIVLTSRSDKRWPAAQA